MRLARVKPDYQDTWHHAYNRIAGGPGDLPFGPVEKERFVQILHQLTTLYTVRILGYCVMGNHFHLIARSPVAPPSLEETARRYIAFHRGKRQLDPASPYCATLRCRLRDISCFMGDLEQRFTRWYNRTRPARRRGYLWAGRFKNTVLEDGLAVWDCLAYIEMNPVRAGLVENPAGYRFCSFGVWSQSGRHPFAETLSEDALPSLKGLLHVETAAALATVLRREFARLTALRQRLPDDQAEAAIRKAGRPQPFTTQAHQRVRYWVDGLAIGSELFVRQVMAKTRGAANLQRHRLVRALTLAGDPSPPLCAYRHLRQFACT